MSHTNGTALTRHGSRVRHRATQAAPPVTTDPRPMVVPQAVIRQMMVCVPDELAAVLDSTRSLGRHLGVSGTSCRRIWVSPTLRPWQRRQLIDWQKTKTGPRCCAGGPVRLLDLTGMAQAAHTGAVLRHQQWSHVVAGTRPATPWAMFLQRHLTDPSDYPLDTATAAFHRQPRVQAMRMHNAAAYGSGHLDPADLEIFQSGGSAYANYHALWATCTDALLTEDGHRLHPASAFFADRITYLQQANHHLRSLHGTQQVFAIDLQTP